MTLFRGFGEILSKRKKEQKRADEKMIPSFCQSREKKSEFHIF
jgi:hypothetical protein